jgi:hypothetical protein
MLLEQAIREAASRLPASHQALLQPAGREALARYLDGGRVVFRVDRAADIRRIVAFAQRAGMKPVIAGATEGWRVARELAQAGVPVLLDPCRTAGSFDTIGARSTTPRCCTVPACASRSRRATSRATTRTSAMSPATLSRTAFLGAALAALTANRRRCSALPRSAAAHRRAGCRPA